jgi:hypothetical protein
MPKFRPGQSGNPSGRPKSSAGLRELLIEKYGPDAGVLVGRLEKLSIGRNLRLALQATELLLNYHAGKPDNAFNVAVTTQPAPWTEVQMTLLTNEELDSLAAISRRLHPDTEGANRLRRPDLADHSGCSTSSPSARMTCASCKSKPARPRYRRGSAASPAVFACRHACEKSGGGSAIGPGRRRLSDCDLSGPATRWSIAFSQLNSGM